MIRKLNDEFPHKDESLLQTMDFQKIGISSRYPFSSFRMLVFRGGVFQTFFRTNIIASDFYNGAGSSHSIQHSWHCLEGQEEKSKKDDFFFVTAKNSQASTPSASQKLGFQ